MVAVVRQTSFVAAADALGASPAYVSKRIRILETQLGVRLLHRTTRRVRLTDEGERIHVDLDGDDDDEEYEKKVMTIAHQELCIGCTACSKICPKKCYTHAAAAA